MLLNKFMNRKRIRRDIMSKTEYSKVHNVNRATIDKMIKDGDLSVEVISNKAYIIIKPE